MALAILRPTLFSHRIPLLRSSTTINSNSLHAKPQQQQRSISLSSYIVSPKELNEALKKNVPTKISTSPRVIPLCAAWFMPNDPQGRKGIDVYKQKRIPNARFFDIDVVKDPESPYPHMLPSKERFAEAMRSMGIRRDDEVVVYDTEEQGLLSAPRVGWTMRFFGHPNVHVLDNFKLWVREGYPVEEGEVPVHEACDYQVDNFTPDRVVHFEEIREIAEDHGKEGSDGVQILDARPNPRWSGAGKEPRPGLPSGHMPGSVNVQFSDLVEPETRTLLPAEELKRVFLSKGVDPTRPVITTCGSGVTAAVVDIALEKAEFVPLEHRRLYDGSWTEYAQRVPEDIDAISVEKHITRMSSFTRMPAQSPTNRAPGSFQIISDLHLEISRQYSSMQIPPCEPNLILAGDIGRLSDYSDYLNFLKRHINQFQRIFLVLGNHEFYGMSYSEGLLKARELENEPALDGRLVVLDKVRYDVPNSPVTILGCTLWSRIAAEEADAVRSRVKDFRNMLDRTVEEHNANHETDVSWLNQQVDSVCMENKQNDGCEKRVLLIVTHYAPSVDGTSSPRHARSAWSSAFATDILSRRDWPGVEYWIFGHTHYSTEFVENSVRVLSNQRGYTLPEIQSGNEEGGFDVTRVIRL